MSCGLARPRGLVDGELTQIAATHGPGVQSLEGGAGGWS